MKHRFPPLRHLSLKGLQVAPSQVCGGVRLVPLIRERVRGDLRLWQRPYGDDLAVVDVDRRPAGPQKSYLSYVPHGLVLRFSDEGEAVAAWGTQLYDPASGARSPASVRRSSTEGERLLDGPFRVRGLHRMVKREAPDQLRLLPLHLAMEGFLELCFSGPDLTWPEYAPSALRFGLSPRVELSYSGRAIAGLDRALRLFEIHEGQSGVLLYVQDALAAAFVVPHPDDYRALHRTLLADFFGPEIIEFGRITYQVPELAIPPSASADLTLGDLEDALKRCKDEWRAFHALLSDHLIEREIEAVGVYKAGPFQLQRMMTQIGRAARDGVAVERTAENHLGEVIVREDGTLEYLKTYRLSWRQAERALLLQTLQAHHFHLDGTAKALRMSRERLILRVVTAGFGALFKPEVIKSAHEAVHGKPRRP